MTLLTGYVFCLLGFVAMLTLWDEVSPYWQVALGYALVGIGVGFAGTPASHSLTGSVPVTRAGMASGTADLQRDLGGAIMQSILGALLTAGYATAFAAAIAGSADADKVSDSVEAQLTKSFAGAEQIAKQYPQYADAITAGAKQSTSSTAPTGPTPASSRSSSAVRSCSSSSRGSGARSGCSPSTTPRTRPPERGRLYTRPARAAACAAGRTLGRRQPRSVRPSG